MAVRLLPDSAQLPCSLPHEVSLLRSPRSSFGTHVGPQTCASYTPSDYKLDT